MKIKGLVLTNEENLKVYFKSKYRSGILDGIRYAIPHQGTRNMYHFSTIISEIRLPNKQRICVMPRSHIKIIVLRNNHTRLSSMRMHEVIISKPIRKYYRTLLAEGQKYKFCDTHFKDIVKFQKLQFLK